MLRERKFNKIEYLSDKRFRNNFDLVKVQIIFPVVIQIITFKLHLSTVRFVCQKVTQY